MINLPALIHFSVGEHNYNIKFIYVFHIHSNVL